MPEPAPILSTKAAVYSGIISTEPPRIQASCKTANCTWPVVPTLAACGQCSPIAVNTKCNQTSKICTYSTPATFVDGPLDSSGYSLFKVSPSAGSVYPIDSTKRAYFSVFDMISVSRAEGEELVVQGNECSLSFCIQAYSITVNLGIQNESLVGSWSTTVLGRGAAGSHGAEHSFVDVPADELNVDPGSRYAVTHEALTALRSFMAGVTTGTVYADVSHIDYSSDWVEAMWNASDHLQNWVETFAATMTGEIRRHGTLSGSTERRYDGYATQLAPFIRVQWYWLFYPCLMILLSVFYFFHTIIDSARAGVEAWKGGVLPMLFCRVDDDIQEKVGDGMDQPDGLNERVGDLAVALYRDEKGQWAFRTTSAEEK